MKILLTGAFGNIGPYVLEALLDRGHEVRSLALGTERERRKAQRFDGRTHVVWGDVRDPSTVQGAVDGVDIVMHLAAMIPPGSEAAPDKAREINVGGTENIIAACLAQPTPPKLVFSSTFDVHGNTVDKQPPRRIDDPFDAIDEYSQHKIEGEALVRASGLTWFIPRFVDVPIIGPRKAEPIMYEIGLRNRIEVIHPKDLGLAMANALETDEVWGATMFIGGGAGCQVTYKDFLTRIMGAMGMRPLPESAFADKPYATDWVDTTESQKLLKYQRYDFDKITDDIAASLGWKRHLVPLARPFAERTMLKMSPYYK
ncbi:NAD-dependent epimerase/dehydratase family protein [Antrihabitans cavernicola]|uniref:NAD(P)-dependent oxidoreductase n=1 Tax=Antrihabitans cavernicola TaxID=2495913 RepID=A0A5A7S9Q7_9NOCA|nr:NAD(P)-dependent oxidoreductase [Spelaeibacter cavernicola]KAA0021902.1 NAD(P)-dependent oxidoreductase [Spelaeibacter cavernicola]